MKYKSIDTIQLIHNLLRRERLIAMIESGLKIMDAFDPEITQHMLKAAYNEKRDIEAELSFRKLEKKFDLFLEMRDKSILYTNSIEELQKKGMPAPLTFEPKMVNQC